MELFADLAGSTTFLVIAAVVVVLAIGVLVADARPPRWLRTRRRLADMFEASRVEAERQAIEALIAAREAAGS